MRRARPHPGAVTVLALAPALLAARAPQDDGRAGLTAQEVRIALELSPLPPPPPDPTNAVYESEAAARLGQALFFDTRFSRDGQVSCATCHAPELSWTDGRALARGLAGLPRHTMSLWNVAYNRWFFWDGRKDTLWSQALAPLEDEREHGSSRLEIAHALAADPGYRAAWAEVFGPLPDLGDAERFPPAGRPVPGQPRHPHSVAWDGMTLEDQLVVEEVFVGVGKAIAAYERRLLSRRAPFDVFVEGLREDDPEKLAALTPSARRGFSLFAGRGNCILCHDGPNFTDLEFHTNLFPSAERSDPGRPIGIRKLQRDPFNSRSRWADDGGERGLAKLRFAPRDVHVPGEFKTPSLRNVARTAPYLHEGQLATLPEVVAYYSSLEGAAPRPRGGERILQPLHLDDGEQADLLAFLEALSDESLPAELRAPLVLEAAGAPVDGAPAAAQDGR